MPIARRILVGVAGGDSRGDRTGQGPDGRLLFSSNDAGTFLEAAASPMLSFDDKR